MSNIWNVLKWYQLLENVTFWEMFSQKQTSNNQNFPGEELTK